MLDLQNSGFDIEDKGDISDYLGVHVEKLSDGKLKLSQPQLIQQIISDLGEDLKSISHHKVTTVPALSSRILQRDEQGEPHDKAWHYRSVIGKLNFLEMIYYS